MMRFRIVAVAACLTLGILPAAASSPWAIIGRTTGRLWQATRELPHAAITHWRVTVPAAAGTAALIAFGDRRLSDHVDSPSLERNSRNWSDRGLLYIEPAFVLTAAAVEDHCLFCPETGRFALVGLTAEAYNTAAVQAIKFASGRERPYMAGDGDGGFNEGGRSFPSGHAAGAFTLAALLAQHDPCAARVCGLGLPSPGEHKRGARRSRAGARAHEATWFNRGAWLLAGGVSGLRFTAKEHFPSDILVGAALGTYLGAHAVQTGH